MFFPNDTGPQSGYVVFEEGIGIRRDWNYKKDLSEPRLR